MTSTVYINRNLSFHHVTHSQPESSEWVPQYLVFSGRGQMTTVEVQALPVELPETVEIISEGSVSMADPAKAEPAKKWKSYFTYEKFELGTELEDLVFWNVTLAKDIGDLKASSVFGQVFWNISQVRLLLYPTTDSSTYYEAKLDFKLRGYRGPSESIPRFDKINESDLQSARSLQNFHGVCYHDFFHYLYDHHMPARKSKGADGCFDFKFWICRIDYNIDRELCKGRMFYQISWLPSVGLALFYPVSDASMVYVKRITYTIWGINELQDME